MPFPAMGETFDFMQKMWGMSGMPSPGNLASMAARLPQQMPSMIAPTVDIGELDKRIADLRAVEQWLELNAGMLRTTIQTLEVQRATIATLKGISGAMLGSMFSQAPESSPNPFTAARSPAPAPVPAPGPVAPPPVEPVVSAARQKKAAPSSAPKLADDALNPAAWWNTLQDQFSRIASVATETPSAAPKKAKRPARRTRKKA
jgi:hypothetical protein